MQRLPIRNWTIITNLFTYSYYHSINDAYIYETKKHSACSLNRPTARISWIDTYHINNFASIIQEKPKLHFTRTITSDIHHSLVQQSSTGSYCLPDGRFFLQQYSLTDCWFDFKCTPQSRPNADQHKTTCI